MTLKHYSNWLAAAASIVLLLTVSSCKKQEENQPPQVSLDLPSDLTVAYGEIANVTLPAALISQSGLTFNIGFSETENIQISGNSKLYDKLGKAITLDKTQGKITVDSRQLYPNGATSSVTGTKIPDTYKVTVSAVTAQGVVTGKQILNLKIAQGKIMVKGLDDQKEMPYAYVLYSDKGASFELQAAALLTEGNSWYLPPVKDAGSVVSLSANQLNFTAAAGDPKKQAEQAYDLEPALQKDGFTVASTRFRVVFIPQIKFFYGTYYPEYNLTILLNLVHISLSNGYLSAAPTLYPQQYKSTFSLGAITKDGAAFADTDGIFEVNSQTGAVTVKQNTKLQAGSYKFIIKAMTTVGLEFSTDLTLAMEAG